MRVVIYHSDYQGLTESMRVGIGRFNHKIVVVPVVRYKGLQPCDAVVTIGAGGNVERIHKDCREAGILCVCISDGLIRRRKGWESSPFGMGPTTEARPYWAVARNGLHAYGEHVGLNGRDGGRWAALNIKLRPWRKKGEQIVLAFQPYRRPISIGPGKVDRTEWFRRQIKQLLKATSRPLVFKPHPHERRDVTKIFGAMNAHLGNKMRYTTLSLAQLFKQGVWAVVTYDSNAAVDASIYGVPVFVGGNTMADPVSNRNLDLIERPAMPDRTAWANWVAWTQWTREDMKAGLPWRYLVEEWEKYKG